MATVTLSSLAAPLIIRLQNVQNNAARLILGISKSKHISLHLASLHWLPIDSRIKYKLACICYNCVSTICPTSLTFLPFLPLPVSFAHLLTTLSSFVHLSVQYHMVKCPSHTPPLLLGILFLSRPPPLIMSLLSDPELKLILSVLLECYPFFPLVLYQLCCWMSCGL